MEAVFYILIAVVGAAISQRRARKRGEKASFADTWLRWWIVWVIGVASVIGALFHIFDGPQIAAEIGYTRGDGGFQFENAMGDMAIGVAAIFAWRYRGLFWLAVIGIATIQFFGDAGGHLWFWLAEGDTQPDNIGGPLALDILGPAVAWALWAMSRREGGDARLDWKRPPKHNSELPTA